MPTTPELIEAGELIQNSPYEEPKKHWSYVSLVHRWTLTEGRRPAGFLAQLSNGDFEDAGAYHPIPLANTIRERVKKWRESDYPGVTGITKRLLEHWHDTEQRRPDRRFFFAQLEAVETLIWLTESAPSERSGLDIQTDGGDYIRECCKMATGTGKTIVMGLTIVWQALNKVAYPADKRFTKNVLVIAPSITVRDRLSALTLADPQNVYHEFRMIPSGLLDRFTQAQILVLNWHGLAEEEKPSLPGAQRQGSRVLKHVKQTPEAFCRRVLAPLGGARNILVINDEAHHCWRLDPKTKKKDIEDTEIWDPEEATVWVKGLDRIDAARGIFKVYDFTATPFAPTGKRSLEETLFQWIVSDFGLNDAIESGLVKTPRVAIRDDVPGAKPLDRSQFYHIYRHVATDLGPRAPKDDPLPDLVKQAYLFLTHDWATLDEQWRSAGHDLPPVMISVANNTRTAERVHNALAKGKLGVQASKPSEGLLRIDTDVLKGGEEDEAFLPANPEDEGSLTGPQREALLRAKVNTVGKRGQPGADIRNVVSVAMLSEGWDCRTVTHIMGLRAFSSQLLCEQVIGRGLRRTSYEVDEKSGLFQPEYVNVFGVPFTFLPLEGSETGPPRPVRPTTMVGVVPGRRKFEITWPNIARIQPSYAQELTINVDKIPPIHLDPKLVRTRADLGALMDGRPNVDSKKEIQLRELADTEFRLQRTIFQAAQRVYEAMEPDWKGNKSVLLGQVVRLVEDFIRADKIDYGQVRLDHDDVRRRILLALNMERIVQHIWHHIKYNDLESVEIVFDEERPTMSTGEMAPWDTRRQCIDTRRSQINPCVIDSSWEADAALPLDEHDAVEAWVKNDHLGFEIRYSDAGRSRSYTPDFLIRLGGDHHLIVEVKGQRTPTDQAKWNAAREWAGAVNSLGTFGTWEFEVIEGLGEMAPLLNRASKSIERGVETT